MSMTLQLAFRNLAIFFLLYALIVVFFYYWSRRRLFSFKNKFNGPKTVPLLGNLISFMTFPDGANFIQNFFLIKFVRCVKHVLYLTINREDFLSKLSLLTKVYGTNTIRFFLGWDLYIYLVNPNDVQVVLNNALSKADVYFVMEDFAGDGIIRSSVPMWTRYRKMLNSTFKTATLHSYISSFNKQSKILVGKLKDEANGSVFNIGEYIFTCAFQVISENLLGYKINNESEVRKMCYNIKMADFLVFGRLLKFWERTDTIFYFKENGRKLFKVIAYVHAVFNKIIQEKRSELKQKHDNASVSAKSNYWNHEGEGFMDILLAEKNRLSDKQVLNEISTMVFAGTDTSASSSAFSLMLLGMNQDIQEKCYQELYEIFGNSDRDVELEDLQRMPYLEQCFKESLRIFPPVPLVARKVDEDLNISDGVIPEGANVILYILGIHRNPDLYPNPEKFDPDRFLPENIKKRPPNTYIPFSSGPRNCIGLKFARLSILIQLSHILRRYQVFCDAKVEDIKLMYSVVCKPVGGFPVRLKERNTTLRR